MHTTHYAKYGCQKYGTGQHTLAGWGWGGYNGFGADASATSAAVTLATDFSSDLQKQANEAKQAGVAASATGNPMAAAIFMAAGNAIQNQANAVDAAADQPKPPAPKPSPNFGTLAVVAVLGLGVLGYLGRR